jgi:signal transduction histidine kinase
VRVGLLAGLQGAIQTGATMAGAWFVGDWARTRHLYLGALEAEALAREREREERERRVLVEERERIARDLHDIVTHHVSVIVIQAGAGLAAVDTGGREVRRTLEAIDSTGRRALTDMRRMFEIIGEADSRSPMPRLDQLGELLEQVRTAGLSVRLSIEGDQPALDPGLELSAYRIVQEALTNALKHARGAAARVDIRYEPDAIAVVVENDGGQGAQGVDEAHAGRGLAGMRQRAAMVGGTLEAHPTATGFRVSARLPLEQPAGAA